jgi:hypothetical protein
VIELDISESVTRGGVRRVTWHVAKDDDTWLSVTEVPGADIRDPASTAGVIWHKHVLVTLPLGARLMRVESEPERAPPKDPMAYLWQGRPGVRRKVKRSYFRVGAAGKLVRVSGSDS